MTPSELRRALEEASKTGKLGVPVAIRLHWQRPSCDDWAGWLETALDVLSPVLRQPPDSVQAQQHPVASQWNILLQNRVGQTFFLTLGTGTVTAPVLHLLVTGNHGTLRLEGNSPCDPIAAEPSSKARHWWSVIRESALSGCELSLEKTSAE